MKQNRLEKILLEVYEEVYKKLGVNIHELIENGTTKKENWFLDYTMPFSEQEEIFEKVLSKYKLNEREIRALKVNYWLGGSPKSEKSKNKNEKD